MPMGNGEAGHSFTDMASFDSGDAENETFNPETWSSDGVCDQGSMFEIQRNR